MKLISIVAAALAATSVQGAALQRWCSFPGQGCYLVKRAADTTQEVKRSADAMTDAMAEASATLNRWCHFPGQGCTKAKRAIDAVGDVKRSADVLAEAMAILDELQPEDFVEVEE
ncbi:mating alpha-pheromone PpgA [Aspergillus pseudoustus]|uniref:Mating alpha-pheromone PpgA n=1 Tax=Aspergillus pseudoustus TaxID=1810923 RepID=A0ABR4KZK2_9EURO